LLKGLLLREFSLLVFLRFPAYTIAPKKESKGILSIFIFLGRLLRKNTSYRQYIIKQIIPLVEISETVCN
jgi:hypothetical protein